VKKNGITWVTKYKLPPLDGQRVLYKGRRYFAIEATEQCPFQEFNKGIVLWDAEYECTFAVGELNEDGYYEGDLYDTYTRFFIARAKTIREYMKNALECRERFLKIVCGD